MSINLVVAVTDGDWFEMLRRQPDLSEVIFLGTSQHEIFVALKPGDISCSSCMRPSEHDCRGGEVLAYANVLPCSFLLGRHFDKHMEHDPRRNAKAHRALPSGVVLRQKRFPDRIVGWYLTERSYFRRGRLAARAGELGAKHCVIQDLQHRG